MSPPRSRTGFDPTFVRDLVGNDRDFLREIAGLFERDSRRLARGLTEALRSLDAPRLARDAHTLKGLLSHFGHPPAIELAGRLETLGDGRTLEGAGGLVEEILAEIDLIREGLARL